jgi:hypothetical protein
MLSYMYSLLSLLATYCLQLGDFCNILDNFIVLLLTFYITK